MASLSDWLGAQPSCDCCGRKDFQSVTQLQYWYTLLVCCTCYEKLEREQKINWAVLEPSVEKGRPL